MKGGSLLQEGRGIKRNNYAARSINEAMGAKQPTENPLPSLAE